MFSENYLIRPTYLFLIGLTNETGSRPMALESNSAWIRDQQKANEQQLFVSEAVHVQQQRPPTKTYSKQHSQTERYLYALALQL